MKSSYKKSYRKKFLLFPVAFLLLTFVILFVTIAPIVAPYTSLLDMVFLEKAPDLSNNYASILDKNQPAATAEELKASDIELPAYGTHFGTITIDNTQVNAELFFGDGKTELKNGVGIYNGSFVPGYGKTILIAGHNHTYFHTLGNAKLGDKINITTNYGQYVYEIVDTKVTTAEDASAYDLAKEEENLILYTCYPFDQIGLTPQRYFVYGKYVSGPKINIYE